MEVIEKKNIFLRKKYKKSIVNFREIWYTVSINLKESKKWKKVLVRVIKMLVWT